MLPSLIPQRTFQFLESPYVISQLYYSLTTSTCAPCSTDAQSARVLRELLLHAASYRCATMGRAKEAPRQFAGFRCHRLRTREMTIFVVLLLTYMRTGNKLVADFCRLAPSASKGGHPSAALERLVCGTNSPDQTASEQFCKEGTLQHRQATEAASALHKQSLTRDKQGSLTHRSKSAMVSLRNVMWTRHTALRQPFYKLLHN